MCLRCTVVFSTVSVLLYYSQGSVVNGMIFA